MNKNQKRILMGMIIMIVGMMLFPPFQKDYRSRGVLNEGYGFILDPPKQATVNVPLLLVQWCGVLIIGGLSLYLLNESSNKRMELLPPIDNENHRTNELRYKSETKINERKKIRDISGVGGWLGLLVAGMMFLGPIMGAGRINSDIMSVENQFPKVIFNPQWGTYKTATWSIFCLVAIISFYGGSGLAFGKNWIVVKRARVILWIIGPVASLVMGIFIPLIIFGNSYKFDPKFAGAFTSSVIAAAIWTAYLSKSKRVKNTYGHKENTFIDDAGANHTSWQQRLGDMNDDIDTIRKK